MKELKLELPTAFISWREKELDGERSCVEGRQPCNPVVLILEPHPELVLILEPHVLAQAGGSAASVVAVGRALDECW